MAELYTQYRPLLIGWLVKQFEIDHVTAEDCVQEAFIYILSRVDFRPDKPISFLLACAARATPNVLRSLGKGGWQPQRPAPGMTPAEEVEYNSLKRRVDSHIEAAEPFIQHRLVLRIYDEAYNVPSNCREQIEAASKSLQALRKKLSDVQPTNKPPKLKMTESMSNRFYHEMECDVVCVETGERFDSPKLAGQSVGVKGCTVSDALSGKSGTAGGRHWEYRKRPEGRREKRLYLANA